MKRQREFNENNVSNKGYLTNKKHCLTALNRSFVVYLESKPFTLKIIPFTIFL